MRAEIRRLRALETDIRAEYRAFLAAALERLDGEPDEPRGERQPRPRNPSGAAETPGYTRRVDTERFRDAA